MDGLTEAAPTDNPHYRFVDLTQHGYGLLEVTPQSVRAQIWYSEILARSDEETMAAELEVLAGENHWAQ